jgi:hypothetical protein
MRPRLLIAIVLVLQSVCVFSQVEIRATNQENTTLRHSNPMIVINAGDKTLQIPPAVEPNYSFSLDLNKDMKDIKTSWIQSIAVLKDKQAIDKYGAPGTYGVVIIELKENAFEKMPAHLAEKFRVR